MGAGGRASKEVDDRHLSDTIIEVVVPFAVQALAALMLVAPVGTAVGKAKAPATKRAPKPPRVKSVALFHVNSKETLRLRFVDDQGRPIKALQKRADRFFRCHHTRKPGKMHPRLLRLLFETGRHFGGKRIEVVSGYRHPTVAKNPKSPHMKGLATDFRVVGVKNTELRDYLRGTFKKVGIGYYPNSSFVHLDVRQTISAFWIDYSGPGESSLYADNPNDDLRTGRADSWKPAQIDPAWAEGEAVPAAPGSPPGAESHQSASAPPATGVLPPVQ